MSPLTHTTHEAAQVTQQLGRDVRGHWSVVHRCHLGIPTVIENHPQVEGRPFPTLFWLTCPLLVKRISRQEAGGRMAELNERLDTGDPIRARLAASIEAMRVRRDAHGRIEDSGSPPGGGPDRIKCLHAHAAQELADPPDPIGALALAQAGFPDCVAPCVRGDA
jgi:hypothetical protein